MNNRIKLSVLIPTYNREELVRTAIESVLNQEFSDFEIICCDNASTDKTYEILEEYSKKDKRIKIFQNDYNLGPALNWKRCLDNASGEFVHWLWSDDWIESNFYIDAFNLMIKDNTQIVSTWNYRADNLENINDKYLSWQFSYPYISGKIAAKKILLLTYELPLSPAAYILPLELAKKHFYLNIPKFTNKLDPVNKAVGIDSLMIIGSCLDVENISILQKPSVVFRQHNNISFQLSKDGSLAKMYMMSHLWFILNNQIKLNFSEYLFLVKKVFSIKFTNRTIFSYLIKLLSQKVSISNTQLSIFDYPSKKAFFKRKINVILSDKFNNFDLKNKSIYLAPYNDVTEELYKKFSQFNPKNIVFIDNFRKGENIITAQEIQEYDYVFIYSPNYEMEIIKLLPKKNIFLIKNLKENKYDYRRFSGLYKLKKYISNKFREIIKIKEKSLFKNHPHAIYLSRNFLNINLSNKKIYLTPYNDFTRNVCKELQKYNNSIIKYIDHRYKQDNIINYFEMKNYDYIFIDRLYVGNRNIKYLPKKNKYFFYKSYSGINIYPYNLRNILKSGLTKYFFLLYLNVTFMVRIFFAYNMRSPLHFNERKILNLKNKYEGKRAFVIGNGPSLKIEDLDKLENEITFAANKIYLAYSETKWRPTFYSVEDDIVMNEIYEDIKKIKDSGVILPIKDLRYYKKIDNAIYYPLKRHSGGFSKNMLEGLYPGHTVTYTMLQMAVYMGIKEIYFIGLDFNYEFSKNINEETNIIHHKNEINHFHKDYRKPQDKWIKPNIEGQIKAYEIAKAFCEKNNIKIYNASRNTKLEVFQLIDFDTLFD
ncbi:glycosyltransferase [Aliarcobacter butzleri]|uniref:glycosyltransferase n=1 Tax=Aliarcobacter butzleri TaxID=28197 RepID=UPI003AFAFA4B